jgi:hypothetical protein
MSATRGIQTSNIPQNKLHASFKEFPLTRPISAPPPKQAWNQNTRNIKFQRTVSTNKLKPTYPSASNSRATTSSNLISRKLKNIVHADVVKKHVLEDIKVFFFLFLF